MKMTSIAATATAAVFLLLGAGACSYAVQEHQGERQDHPGAQHEAQSQQQHTAPPQQHVQQQPQPQPQQQHAQQPQQPHAQKQPQQPHAQKQPQQPRAVQQPHVQPQEQHAQQPQPQHVQQPQQQSNQMRQQLEATQQHPQQMRGSDNAHRTPEQQHIQQSAWQQHRAGNWQSDHRNWQQRGGYTGFRIPDDRFRGYFGNEHGFRIGGLPFLLVGGNPRFQYNGYWFSMVDPYPGDWSDDWYDSDEVYVMYSDGGYYLYNRRHPGIGIAISITM